MVWSFSFFPLKYSISLLDGQVLQAFWQPIKIHNQYYTAAKEKATDPQVAAELANCYRGKKAYLTYKHVYIYTVYDI